MAVAKVEELTRQLEELRRGKNNREPPTASALELDKLRRELMVSFYFFTINLNFKSVRIDDGIEKNHPNPRRERFPVASRWGTERQKTNDNSRS